MVCIVGVNIFDNKYVVILLIYIFGVGNIKVKVICELVGINLVMKIRELMDEQFDVVCNEVVKYLIEGDLC